MDAMTLTDAGSSGSKVVTGEGTFAIVAGEDSPGPLCIAAGVLLGDTGCRGIVGMLAGWPRRTLSFALAALSTLWAGVTNLGTIIGGFVGKLVGAPWSCVIDDAGIRGGYDMKLGVENADCLEYQLGRTGLT
jgi:hypothetical protein